MSELLKDKIQSAIISYQICDNVVQNRVSPDGLKDVLLTIADEIQKLQTEKEDKE